MNDERTEFLIAQLADGTLDETMRAQVEQLVSSNDEARALFESYRKIDSALRASSAKVDANILTSDQVIEHIDAQSARSIRIGWLRSIGSIAAAACVFVMIAGGLRSIWPSEREVTESLAKAPVIKVSGPMSIMAASRPRDVTINVSIGSFDA